MNPFYLEGGEQDALLLKLSRETGPSIQELRGTCKEMVTPKLSRFAADWLVRMRGG